MAESMSGEPGSVEISVCMATYNGARFVDEQVESILAQLGDHDELIVVDDASTDDTVARLEARRDPRISVRRSTCNEGYVRAFERALSLARGEHVFLADQDDAWPPGRVVVMREALGRGSVVAGNVAVLGGPDRLRGPFGEADWRVRAETSDHTLRNVLRLAISDMPYFGSAMALRRDVLEVALPFPGSVLELHDAWLALVGLATHSMVHIDERVVLRRQHGANTTGRIRSPWLVVRGRYYVALMILTAWRRARGARRRSRGR
jgi:glycosyltransferase involved in cell wall biosynthesis